MSTSRSPRFDALPTLGSPRDFIVGSVAALFSAEVKERGELDSQMTTSQHGLDFVRQLQEAITSVHRHDGFGRDPLDTKDDTKQQLSTLDRQEIDQLMKGSELEEVYKCFMDFSKDVEAGSDTAASYKALCESLPLEGRNGDFEQQFTENEQQESYRLLELIQAMTNRRAQIAVELHMTAGHESAALISTSSEPSSEMYQEGPEVAELSASVKDIDKRFADIMSISTTTRTRNADHKRRALARLALAEEMEVMGKQLRIQREKWTGMTGPAYFYCDEDARGCLQPGCTYAVAASQDADEEGNKCWTVQAIRTGSSAV